jgi:hypothetical protein
MGAVDARDPRNRRFRGSSFCNRSVPVQRPPLPSWERAGERDQMPVGTERLLRFGSGRRRSFGCWRICTEQPPVPNAPTRGLVACRLRRRLPPPRFTGSSACGRGRPCARHPLTKRRKSAIYRSMRIPNFRPSVGRQSAFASPTGTTRTTEGIAAGMMPPSQERSADRLVFCTPHFPRKAVAIGTESVSADRLPTGRRL